ncbi:MAG: hypothetical protein WC505_07200 [Patescibacteria group bacterium]
MPKDSNSSEIPFNERLEKVAREAIAKSEQQETEALNDPERQIKEEPAQAKDLDEQVPESETGVPGEKLANNPEAGKTPVSNTEPSAKDETVEKSPYDDETFTQGIERLVNGLDTSIYDPATVRGAVDLVTREFKKANNKQVMRYKQEAEEKVNQIKQEVAGMTEAANYWNALVADPSKMQAVMDILNGRAPRREEEIDDEFDDGTSGDNPVLEKLHSVEKELAEIKQVSMRRNQIETIQQMYESVKQTLDSVEGEPKFSDYKPEIDAIITRYYKSGTPITHQLIEDAYYIATREAKAVQNREEGLRLNSRRKDAAKITNISTPSENIGDSVKPYIPKGEKFEKMSRDRKLVAQGYAAAMAGKKH